MKKITNKQGFTLIEVVLVLAIGGLIFLLAFIAFQQVSTNRRDTQRRSDVARVVAELQNFKADKNSLPTADAAATDTAAFVNFLSSYMGAQFKDPNGAAYTELAGTADPNGSTTAGLAKIQYVAAVNCDGTAGDFKVSIALEKGQFVCRDTK